MPPSETAGENSEDGRLVWLDSPSGWKLALRDFTAAPAADKPVILVFAAMGAPARAYRRLCRWFASQGYPVATLDLRGTGESLPIPKRGIDFGVSQHLYEDWPAAVAWAQFSATLAQLEARDIRDDASKMITLVIDAGYEDYLEDTYPNYSTRLDDIEQLAVFARQFQSVSEFLTQLALLTNVEAEDDQTGNKDDEQIKLSTIHQAKGLEFKVVFAIMLCEGLFPSARSLESVEGEEEERRLFYVAVTRAKDELYLSHPLIRTMPGGGSDMMQQPSRFLGEIPRELIEEWNLRRY